MRYRVTKTYGHELGLSACFRQWRADSHCRFFHGYALSFRLEFASDTLNENNWVIDFGSLKPIKQFLVESFDHKLVMAHDDPALRTMQGVAGTFECADILILDNVGCEAFAKLVYDKVAVWLDATEQSNRVKILSVECCEHAGNSAIYFGDYYGRTEGSE